MEDTVELRIMAKLKEKIIICNFTKTISSSLLTALAINIIMANATLYGLLEGLIPLGSSILIVIAIDVYQYKYEKDDEGYLNKLENRIKKLESEQQ